MKLDFNSTAGMRKSHNEDLVASYAELIRDQDEQVRKICTGPDAAQQSKFLKVPLTSRNRDQRYLGTQQWNGPS